MSLKFAAPPSGPVEVVRLLPFPLPIQVQAELKDYAFDMAVARNTLDSAPGEKASADYAAAVSRYDAFLASLRAVMGVSTERRGYLPCVITSGRNERKAA